MASHNELHGVGHISDFPDQAAITAFLRGLLRDGRTQVSWAAAARIPYNTLTNYFTDKAPKMSAENLLRLVIAADAGGEFAAWLAKKGGTIHTRAKTDLEGGAAMPAADFMRSVAAQEKPKKKQRPA